MILNQASQRLDFPNAIRISAAILGAFLLMANSLYSVACSKRKIARIAAHHQPNFRAMLSDWPYSISILSWVSCFAWIPQHQVACYPSFHGRRAFCINLGLFFPCELYLFIWLVSDSWYSIEDFYLQSYAVYQRLEPSFAFYLVRQKSNCSVDILNLSSWLSSLFLMPGVPLDEFYPTSLRIDLAHTTCYFYPFIRPQCLCLWSWQFVLRQVWHVSHYCMGFGQVLVCLISFFFPIWVIQIGSLRCLFDPITPRTIDFGTKGTGVRLYYFLKVALSYWYYYLKH